MRLGEQRRGGAACFGLHPEIVGMSGWELLATMRARNAPSRFIPRTANDWPGGHAEAGARSATYLAIDADLLGVKEKAQIISKHNVTGDAETSEGIGRRRVIGGGAALIAAVPGASSNLIRRERHSAVPSFRPVISGGSASSRYATSRRSRSRPSPACRSTISRRRRHGSTTPRIIAGGGFTRSSLPADEARVADGGDVGASFGAC